MDENFRRPFLLKNWNSHIACAFDTRLSDKCKDFNRLWVREHNLDRFDSLTSPGRDETSSQLDWPTSEEMADQQGLVTGSLGRKTSTARLEHQSGFAGEFGITPPSCAGL